MVQRCSQSQYAFRLSFFRYRKIQYQSSYLDSESIQVILMDGLDVTAQFMKERKNKPILNIPNIVILKSSNRDIIPNEKTIYIHFKTRYDFESFYFSSIRASQLSQQKVGIFLEFSLISVSFFSHFIFPWNRQKYNQL